MILSHLLLNTANIEYLEYSAKTNVQIPVFIQEKDWFKLIIINLNFYQVKKCIDTLIQ